MRVVGPRFTMVPDFVLDLSIDAQAFRLYAALLSFANQEGEAFPSMKSIQAKMNGASFATIRRAKESLLEIGLLDVEVRWRDNGSQTSNLYTIYTAPGFARETGEGTTGGRGGVPRMRPPEGESVEPESEGSSPRNPPLTVDRRKVTETELLLAQGVLNAWNEVADQRFTSVDWIRKIVMRVREHPELTLADYRDVIRSALGDPWWDGAPAPAVVFGNGAVFETALARRGGAGRRKARRFGRGMTTADILERGSNGS